MSTSPSLPPKEAVAKEIGLVASTLTGDMQSAAVRKARELGFDLTCGRLSLDETLINLSATRDVLLDAAQKGKLAQLPLKIQYTLFSQTQKASETLASLVNGKDAVQALEDVVEELNASTWQYNLRNLSEQVLGFEQKMNQLKSQETVIREAHRTAQEFETSAQRAKTILEELEGAFSTAGERRDDINNHLEQTSAALTRTTENEARVAELARQAEQTGATTVKHEADASAAAARVQAIADKLLETQAAIESAKTTFEELNNRTTNLLSSFEQSSSEATTRLQAEYEHVKSTTAQETTALREAIARQSDELRTASQALRTETEEQLRTTQSEHSRKLEELRNTLNTTAREAIEALRTDGQAALNRQQQQADEQRNTAQQEHDRLVKQLDRLEEQIKDSIGRATGFSLFHSFQKRQEALAKSKRFWMWMLSGTIVLALALSAWFIYYASTIQSFGPAFFLKLTISLPLIYAIWFCSIQYSRERRLEEEYAFKSNISISLDPYRELVEKLVLKDKPEELAKYTAFVIESVNRVFTSPTEIAFEKTKEPTPIGDIVRAAGEVANGLLKTAKK